MADSDLFNLTAATSVDSDHLLYVAKDAIGSDRKVTPALLGGSIAAYSTVKSGDFTAAVGSQYLTTATCTVTDPTPSEGAGFVVQVRNGTATVGGTAYATAGTRISRSYHSGAWTSRVDYAQSVFGGSLGASADRASAIGLLCTWASVSADTTLTSDDRGKVIEVTVGATNKTITLPTLSGGDAGWEVTIFRVDRSYGKLITSGSGGFSETIRIRRTWSTYTWNGTAWYESERHGPLENVVNPNQFGPGVDGDATVSTGITLTSDAYYQNLTLTAGGSIITSGYRLFISGDLDLRNAASGAIKWNGGAAGHAIGSTGGAVGALLVGNTTGGSTGTAVAGVTGVAGVGAQATNIATSACLVGLTLNRANASGAGGSGTSGAGGVARVAAAGTLQYVPKLPLIDVFFRMVSVLGGAAGQAGSSGAGDGTNLGGGGGGNGKGGGMVQIYARRVLVGPSTPADVIQALGSAGGNGGVPPTGNCGGGGGAGGGSGGGVFLVAGEIVGSTTAGGIDVTGGAGGNGAAGVGTGTAGTGANSGSFGRAIILNLAAGTATASADSAAGNAGSGTTGGTATTQQVQISEGA